MNMDRKYKEAENRTSEYLELKYGTDVQSGLSLAEVRRRRHLCGTYNIAKEKKLDVDKPRNLAKSVTVE